MWLAPHSAFSPSAQVTEDWTSASALPFLRLARSAMWRGKRSPLRSWCRRWKREVWIQHLCSRTSARSTRDPGLAQWIASWRGSPASPCHTPVSVSAPTIRVGCGPKCSASSATAEQGSLSLRTCPGCERRAWAPSSKGLPRSGSMRSGAIYERPMSALRTNETDGSYSLPTPTVGDSKNARNATSSRREGSQHHSGTTLCDVVWATPTAHPRTHTPRPVDHGQQLANQVGGRLNPTWVEWLMGIPTGWTDCEPLATESSPGKPPKPSASSGTA